MKSSKDKIYVLLNGAKPQSLILQSRDTERKPLYTVVEDENGKQSRRALRYSTSHASPFIDEQEDTVRAVIKPIEFTDGNLVVSASDQALQTFLHYHPMNGILFWELDHEAAAQEEFDFMVLENKATNLVLESDIEILTAVGRVLINQNIDKLTSKEVRRDCMLFAKKYPKEFLEALEDPSLERKNIAHMSFSKKYLTTRNNNTEIWYNLEEKKTRLMVVPQGVDHIVALESYFVSEEGLDLFRILQKKTSK